MRVSFLDTSSSWWSAGEIRSRDLLNSPAEGPSNAFEETGHRRCTHAPTKSSLRNRSKLQKVLLPDVLCVRPPEQSSSFRPPRSPPLWLLSSRSRFSAPLLLFATLSSAKPRWALRLPKSRPCSRAVGGSTGLMPVPLDFSGRRQASGPQSWARPLCTLVLATTISHAERKFQPFGGLTQRTDWLTFGCARRLTLFKSKRSEFGKLCRTGIKLPVLDPAQWFFHSRHLFASSPAARLGS